MSAQSNDLTLADLKNACWGGLLTTRAKHSGVTGVVIDGRCRDLAEHREAQYPVRQLGS